MRARLDAVDALYDVAPSAFNAARDRLAARLRREGRGSGAAAVRKLPRLAAIVWAINRLARRHTGLIERVISAFERLKDAQVHRRSEEIRSADLRLRATVEAAVDRAAALMREAGLRVSAATRRRIDATLRGAAVYERAALRDGVLTDELVAPGSDLFAGPHLRALPRPPSKAKRVALRAIG